MEDGSILDYPKDHVFRVITQTDDFAVVQTELNPNAPIDESKLLAFEYQFLRQCKPEFYIEEENLISFYSYWDLNQYLRGLLKGIRLSRSRVMGRVLELWQR